MSTIERLATFPVIECFGPTIQGEGALAGLPTLFVRFGGCDYRCSWCDSMYAVDPAQVRENARRLSATEILDESLELLDSPFVAGMWVTLSGGNPALMDFDRGDHDLIGSFQNLGMKVAVETQGSIWRPWLTTVDHLTVSPKPPSSGMVSDHHTAQTEKFMAKAKDVPYDRRSLKIVVFDDADYEWASAMFERYPLWQKFISAGTDQDALMDEFAVHAGIAERYRWICERVATDAAMVGVRVLPQLHVIAWGTRRGV